MRIRVRNIPIHPGLGSSQPKWKLDYIKNNAATKTAGEMKQILQLSDSFIYDYCKLHNIPLKKIHIRRGHKYGSLAAREAKRKLQLETLSNPLSFERPPAKYDNRTHDEVIAYWENLKV